ncbi:hypothetical protein ABVT39_014376 [Epinephelus coioides]
MGRGVEERAAGYRESEAGPVEDQGEAAGPSGIESRVTRRARKRGREDGETRQSRIEELLLEALTRQAQPGPPAPPDPPRQPPSEDEMFLLILVPSLQRLSPQRKEYVKFHIHKLIFEASPVVLNFDPSE